MHTPHMRVAIFGGSFNPPHIAHALLAHYALATADVEELWVIPCADHAFGKNLASFDDRLQMCRAAFRHLGSSVKIFDVENRLPKPSYTVQTIRFLREQYPHIHPVLVVGSDILDDLHRWREPDALRELCTLHVIPRAGYTKTGDVFLPEISSTEIRRRLSAGEDLSSLCDRAVVDYINKYQIYAQVSQNL